MDDYQLLRAVRRIRQELRHSPTTSLRLLDELIERLELELADEDDDELDAPLSPELDD